MYAKRGGRGGARGRPRGSARGRGRGRGTVKPSFSKKRSSPDDEEPTSPVTKKAKVNEEELVIKLDTDDNDDPFVSLKWNGTRRVTVSNYKGTTLVSIREYYADGTGHMRPGIKGISLSVDQYNALVSAAPLLETVLNERAEKTVRPTYHSEPPQQPVKAEEEGDAQQGDAEEGDPEQGDPEQADEEQDEEEKGGVKEEVKDEEYSDEDALE